MRTGISEWGMTVYSFLIQELREQQMIPPMAMIEAKERRCALCKEVFKLWKESFVPRCC